MTKLISNEQREAIVRKAVAERDALLSKLEADKAQPAPAVEEIATAVCREVAELPDRPVHARTDSKA